LWQAHPRRRALGLNLSGRRRDVAVLQQSGSTLYSKRTAIGANVAVFQQSGSTSYSKRSKPPFHDANRVFLIDTSLILGDPGSYKTNL
jgi:hypothetical protein